MLNFPRDSQTYKNEPIEENLEQAPEQAPEQSFEQATEGRQLRPRIPSITIEDPEQNRTVTYDSEESLTETEMSSRSHHHSSSSSKGKSHSSSHAKSSKTKKDDWSEITDPEERRRVQNRIAQRKFRDKAKEAKERQDRDTENRAHAHASYQNPDPRDMRTEDELSGLPWGGLNLKHVISKGRSQEDSRREGSRMDENRSNYYAAEEAPVYDDRYETHSNTHYEGEDPIYWSGSGSGHGGSSR